jgi:Tol biopolymer transport system component
MPAWSSDGSSVYFIRTTSAYTKWSLNGAVTQYVLTYPLLMRVPASGGAPQQLATGLFSKGSYSWFFWIRQPAPDPADPNRVAVVSDGPDPLRSDTVLQLFDVTSGKSSVVKGLTETPPLGHQDPTWRPDGALLLYTRNGRDGSRGAPEIWAWDPGTAKSRQVTSAGYLQPSWSPDGRYFAATKTSQYGTDVVVIDPATGAEVLRVTSDGESFAPAWSPRGDAIAYLHSKGGIIDLRMASLEGSGSTTKVTETIDLTTVSGLDGQSRPSWYIPASELPPSPSPSAAQSQAAPSTAGPSPSPSP